MGGGVECCCDASTEHEPIMVVSAHLDLRYKQQFIAWSYRED